MGMKYNSGLHQIDRRIVYSTHIEHLFVFDISLPCNRFSVNRLHLVSTTGNKHEASRGSGGSEKYLTLYGAGSRMARRVGFEIFFDSLM